MAEVVERVANLEGRWDAQAKQLDNIHESLVRLEDKMERRFDAVDRRFTALENHVTALEASTNARFTAVDNRFDGLERRMDQMREEMRSNFRWIMGAVAGGVLTVVTTVLGAMFALRQ
jgi:uncharacterized coiled-coil protein SlyX